MHTAQRLAWRPVQSLASLLPQLYSPAVMLRLYATSQAPRRSSVRLSCSAASLCVAVLTLASCAQPNPSVEPTLATRRAILVSFDALNEQRALATVSPEAIPNFRALFAGAACAASARPAFPSYTAPSHAALWTGVYGNVNGVAGNAQPRLPRNEHTLLQSVSGYFRDALRAEPIWITAGRAGVRVAGHHVTQAPAAPGYPYIDRPDPALDSARSFSALVLAQDNVLVMNGYNVMVAPSRLLTERDATPRAAQGWAGIASLQSGVPPLEIAWQAGTDSLFAILHGGQRYDRVLVSPSRDVARGTTARLASDALPRRAHADSLARHFAKVVIVESATGPVSLTARLFELAPDGSRFALLIPELRVIESNSPEQTRRYLREIGGWFGNGALSVYRAGAFGAILADGGNGQAERRFLESLELSTRQFMRGGEWMWQTYGATLLLDYYPVIDEVDHEWYGLVDSTAAPYNKALAQAIGPYRDYAWALADVRLASLRALVAGDRNAALIVSGDHGMRSYWLSFRPNVALAAAGILVLDAKGEVDLARTQAYSPNGYYVMINRRAWKGGIVAPNDEAALLDRIEAALRAARAPDGTPIVTQTWRATDAGADTLGLGGAAGGDVYFDVARGYYWSSAVTGDVSVPLRSISAGHGYPSTSPEMHTVLCIESAAVAPRRTAPMRNADAALLATDWLRIPHPASASVTPVLPAFLGQRR